MKKISLLLVLFIGIYCHAQDYTQDVVYLKNGSIIKGVIIEQVPNISFKIQTSDGSIFVYPIGDVERMTKDTNPNVIKRNNGSYRGMADFGGSIGIGDYGESTVELSTSHGYQFNPYFFLGAGLGVHYNANYETLFLPIFANIKVNFLNNRLTPFFNAKIGYSFFNGYGFYINPTLGMSFAVEKRSAMTFGIGYVAQFAKIYDNYRYSKSNKNIGGITLKLGIEF